MNNSMIIFDCDGVLVDSEPLAAIAYERAYRKHGMSIATGIIAECVGMKQSDIIARIRDMTGHDFPEESARDIWEETRLLFTEQLQPTKGVVSFLNRHSDARCVASSSSLERIGHSLAVTGLADHFGDAIFSSSMVARGKPAPDIFLYAAREMGFDPASCVVIEDSYFGVQGAVAAGMTAIGFTGGSHTYPGHAERLFASGAAAVCATWDETERELRRRGFLADAA